MPHTICHLHSLRVAVPEAVVTNDDLRAFVDTTDAWIVSRTGIRQRRKLAETDNASDLGLRAAEQVLRAAGVDATALSHIIVASCTPDSLSPSVACIIAGQLGASGMAFDINAACSGFLYGLQVCRSLLLLEPEARILFVCTEALTRRLNWADRSTCVLFGDAAAACLCSRAPEGAMAVVEDVICQSDGTLRHLIQVGGGTSCTYAMGTPVDEHFFLAMQGRETYKHAVRHMVRVCQELLDRNGLTTDDIRLLVPHQANLRIIQAVGERLGLKDDRVFTNVALYGNTSSASIPLALAEARAAGRIQAGDRVLATAFGAGLTWAAALLRYESR